MLQNILNLESESNYSIKGSTFKSFAIPISNILDFRAKHHELKKKYKDANHICYAYRIQLKDRIDEFSSDDGEPKGSSGPPILNILKKQKLINSAIYVIRYFGGTKLGISGLISAYGISAQSSLENSSIIPFILKKEMTITYQYAIQNKIDYIFKEFKINILKSEFGIDIKIKFEIEESKADRLIKKLVNVTNDSIKIII
mgnify:CR=1 FL=1|tara:strand:+ start:2434 stop:3033 length:600 start_codon:yes stop_codon:yes gene_type:complete